MSERDPLSAVTDTAPNAPMLNRAAWVRILPFLVYMLFIGVADVLARLGVPPEPLRWLYAVKIAAVVVTLLICYRHYDELHRWRVGPREAVVALAAGVLVFALWIALNAGWMVVGTPAGFDPRTGGQIDWLMVAVRIGGAALVVPVMEELFWRSFLLRWLDAYDFQSVNARTVRLQSVAIAALLFGIEHHQWLAGIVAGLAYSVLYMRARSLWTPILAHGVTNGVLGVWIVTTGNWQYW
jgi:CAAX prenyl protease-like protein